MQNLINLHQLGAVLLRFVQKKQNGGCRHLRLQFCNTGPQLRNPLVNLKLPFKFRVDRIRTFRDITIRKFRKFGLKCLF